MRLAYWAALLALGATLARHRPRPWHRHRARRILRISRVVADLDRAEAFYRDGLGFERVAAGPLQPRLCALLLPGGTAQVRRMRLGDEEIDLVRWSPPGPAYPAGSRSDDCWFQHLAIVVNDMGAAYARLLTVGPAPISTQGPQALPPSPGQAAGVTAYKFRDPDGHPLELIFFPPGQGRAVWQPAKPGPCLGIDHSALSVTSTRRCLRFYRNLGLRQAAQTLNQGPAQAALDGLPGARARVTGMRPGGAAGPGLELLGYMPPGRANPPRPANAIATDWVTLDTGRGRPHLLRDPDGHRILVTG